MPEAFCEKCVRDTGAHAPSCYAIRIEYRCTAGIVTSDGHTAFQAWLQRDEWTSRRIGSVFPSLDEAIAALEAAE